jgi:acetyl-CoA C-acetyltransferase
MLDAEGDVAAHDVPTAGRGRHGERGYTRTQHGLDNGAAAALDSQQRVDLRDGEVLDGDRRTVELNEAFAAQVIPIMDECDIPLEKLNTHGGAIALGHPFGMTGARIMGTLLNVMETDDHQVGIETMCVAGGQGNAMIVERLN